MLAARMKLTAFAVAFCACQPTFSLLGTNSADLRVLCNDANDCPGGLRCVLALGVCILPGTACSEERDGALVPSPDGDSCHLDETNAGICLGGQCKQSLCGDAFSDLLRGEQCDNGTG